MYVRKSEGQRTKTVAEMKSYLGHNQSNRECGAGQLVTPPSADMKFTAERSQNHIEAAAATGIENPFFQTVAESDPQEQSMLQEGQRARLARLAHHPNRKLLLLVLLLLCEGQAI